MLIINSVVLIINVFETEWVLIINSVVLIINGFGTEWVLIINNVVLIINNVVLIINKVVLRITKTRDLLFFIICNHDYQIDFKISGKVRR